MSQSNFSLSPRGGGSPLVGESEGVGLDKPLSVPTPPVTAKAVPAPSRGGRGGLPELLAPAGSPEALAAAIEGGADAVYFGGGGFNARMLAQNFGGDAMAEAVARCHAYGLRAYVTLNTAVGDREMDACLREAEAAYRAGVDALIVADLGVAAMLRRQIPDLELHASTQASGHNAAAAKILAKLGFARMVCARELSHADIRTLVAESPIEIEMFIHGALCVSHSGQCLFSALVGGRSGNRGACAQPCRLPYTVGGKEAYPLSLRDLSLAPHVPALIDAGVASLKIEGRMKSPEYVRDVVAVWRRLLDEGRGATAEEMRTLADIFSRGGFTDRYFTGLTPDADNRAMLGVRSGADKAASRALDPFRGITRTTPLALAATILPDAPMTLTATVGETSVSVSGDIPQPARTAPLEEEGVRRCLGKLGGTPYALADFTLTLGEGLMVPVSRLNALRRAAIEAISAAHAPHTPHPDYDAGAYSPRDGVRRPKAAGAEPTRTARFARPEQITAAARDYFDAIYLPLEYYTDAADGVVMPPVILDHERHAAEALLREAVAAGAKTALVGNLGQIAMVRAAGLAVQGDFRFNVYSGETLAALADCGVSDCILSRELTLPQIRDFAGARSIIVYGRVPLMTLEKCAIREVADCRVCAKNAAVLTDRRGVRFPMLRTWQHRTLIVNSRPTYMLDKAAQLRAAGVTGEHFIFTVESLRDVDAVINAAKQGRAPSGEVRRI